FHLGVEEGKDITLERLLEDYDAIFLGMGTYKYVDGRLENQDLPGVIASLPYLIGNIGQVLEEPMADFDYLDLKDQRVVVLGGGDTAMDCVR
ncbi:hypothetical protein Q6240_29100, partial [Klebsiella pneumoniae]|nr:hypothetical protein [Klebsiella pneumoniae]